MPKPYNTAMVDIEAFGTNAEAPIISIGLVAFNLDTGETHEGIELDIDFDTAFYGRKPDGDTIKWWLEQSDGARESLTRKDRPVINIVEALDRFTQYLDEHLGHIDFKGRTIWANDPDYDCVILNTAFKQFHKKTPWPFWGTRSCRTLCQVTHGIINRNHFIREGTHHNALDDVKYQALYIHEMWKFIQSRLRPSEETPLAS